MSHLDKKPKRWAIVDNAYPLFHAAGVLAWRNSVAVYPLDGNDITNNSMGSEKWPLLLVPSALWQQWQGDGKENILLDWKIFATAPKKGFVVLLDKNLWNREEPPLEIK